MKPVVFVAALLAATAGFAQTPTLAPGLTPTMLNDIVPAHDVAQPQAD